MSSPLTFTHISASFRPHFFSLCHQLVDFTFEANCQSHFSFLSPYLSVSSSRYFTLPSSHIRTLFSLHFSLYVSLYSETSFLLSSRYDYSFLFSICLSLLICFSASSSPDCSLFIFTSFSFEYSPLLHLLLCYYFHSVCSLFSTLLSRHFYSELIW